MQAEDKSVYRVYYEDGTWWEVETGLPQSLNSERREYDSYDIYGIEGTVSNHTKWTQEGMGYVCSSDLWYTFVVSEQNHRVRLLQLNQTVASGGFFEVADSVYGINVSETSYDAQPNVWCSGYGQVLWHFTAEAAATLYGVFSITIPAHGYWTQLHEIAVNLVAFHAYATAATPY